MNDFSQISEWVTHLGRRDLDDGEGNDLEYDFIGPTLRQLSGSRDGGGSASGGGGADSHSQYYPGDYQDFDYEASGSDDEEEDVLFTDDSSEDETPFQRKLPQLAKGLPSWFHKQPFQYNGRTLFVALPGVILVLALAGDLFLTVATVGAFVTYLIHESEKTTYTLIAYGFTFVCCQMTIIYSAVPLLWLSFFNVLLLFLLNIFSVLTGAWLALNFVQFCVMEPDIARLIETTLFTLYPAVCVALWTWMVTSVTTISLAPYCTLVFGFIILQQCLSPTPSSFVKLTSVSPHNDNHYIVDSSLVGGVALGYVGITPTVYLVVAAVGGIDSFLSLNTVYEWLFITSLSIFCATLLNVRAFLESADISRQLLLQARWCSGLFSLLLLSAVLHKHNFTLYLVPWISMGVAVHAAYGFVVGQKRLKKWSLLTGLMLLLLYSVIFSKLPWAVQYYVSGNMHISVVHLALLTNVGLCILCAYVSTRSSNEVFGLVYTLQTLCFVSCEKVLVSNEMYHSSLILLSAFLSLYLIVRLYINHKLPTVYAWLLSSLHITKLCDCCDLLLSQDTHTLTSHHTDTHTNTNAMWYMYSTVATLAVTSWLTKVLLFVELPRPLPLAQWGWYMVTTAGVLVGSVYPLTNKFCELIFGEEPSIGDMAGILLLVQGTVSIKLHYTSPTAVIVTKHTGPCLVLAAFIVLHLQPANFIEWSELRKLMVLVNVVTLCLLVPMVALVKAPRMLGMASVVLGAPLGLCVVMWLYPSGVCSMMYTLYLLAGVLCVLTVLSAWRDPHYLQAHITYRCILLSSLCCALNLTDYVSPVSDTHTQPGYTCTIAVLAVVSVVFKVLYYTQQMTDLSAPVPVTCSLPSALPGNLCTMLLFVLLLTAWNGYFYMIWAILCSTVLLLIQRDNYICRSTHSSPYAACCTSILATLVTSSTLHSTLWTADSTYVTVISVIELIITALLVPIWVTYVCMLWTNEPGISDRWTVFLAPVPTLYVFFGTSWSSWILGSVTGIISAWLMIYKLPLVVVRSEL